MRPQSLCAEVLDLPGHSVRSLSPEVKAAPAGSGPVGLRAERLLAAAWRKGETRPGGCVCGERQAGKGLVCGLPSLRRGA